MRAVVPPVATSPAPGVARPLEGAVVPVVADGAVVAGVVTGVVVAGVVGVVVADAAVVGVWSAVVGVALVAGVVPPPMGGWVSGTVVTVVRVVVFVGDVGVVLTGVGVLVGGAAVVVFVLLSPLRATTVATPAPKTPTIKTISAMVRSRLRWSLRSGSRGRLPPERLCRVRQPSTRTLRWAHPAGVAQW